ncbi:TIGR04219 family outer membrane beta-barrel protein [Motilimonas pumila]|uniref:TIGR04219 family outer membrane beta-barrel protein n=1 Tax=Motilimonas pumila TaxID=2303987 RepID=A0A418YEM6_9GAMM|nr:TIGR04219 family outer membrane beta-barrel protein [Motilimonas pumila]RJG47579.1 TIGR04219 family outer membrane beta-barrel protein [Motilimonas pumila]
MKKLLALTLLSASISAPAMADDWGIFVGADFMKPSTSGEFEGQDVNLKDDYRGSGYIAVEHSIILLPNAKLAYSNLDTKGKGDNQGFNTDLSSLDAILYYQILDNGLTELDLGLNFRYLDGKAATGESVSSVVPQLYGAAKIGIPSTNFKAFAELTAGSFTDDDTINALAGVSYTFNPQGVAKFSLRGGYRYQEIKLKDDTKFNSEFDGFFLGAEVNF